MDRKRFKFNLYFNFLFLFLLLRYASSTIFYTIFLTRGVFQSQSTTTMPYSQAVRLSAGTLLKQIVK